MIMQREASRSDAAIASQLLVPAQREILARLAPDVTEKLGELIASSEDSFVIEEDGVPLCLGGVIPFSGSFLNMEGYLWMGVCQGFDLHPKKVLLAVRSRRWLNGVKERYAGLHDVCEVGDDRTAIWLRWLGFRFGDPVMSEARGRLVYPVEWRRWA